MAIAEQFAGLQMDKLIGAPLCAAADASTQLANSTADFINRVGFDKDGKVRTVAFGYEKRSTNEDGTSNLDEMKVAVPMLAIVPIPNLQVDEVNILFDMEVKQSEKQESASDMSGSMSGSMNLGIIKVSVSGSVSAHQSNTRSSDNSAKYHVDVRATNHGTPEGLARVLDMMAANVAPMLVGSTLKDGNGQNLSDQARVKAERLKALRQEISSIENQLSAAQNGLSSSLTQMKKVADSQLNVYREAMNRLQNTEDNGQKDDEENGKLVLEHSQAMDSVNQSWSSFQNQVGDFIKMIVDSSTESEGVSDMFALKALDAQGKAAAYGSDESYYSALAAAQKIAVDKQKNVSRLETELFDKRAEYSDAAAGKAQ
jgi:predicted  nucleic acid-binding Zn-ribbon protein